MKLYDPALELDVLRTLCSKKHRKHLAKLDTSFFFEEDTQRIFTRIKSVKEQITWRNLSKDPGLSEQSRERIKDAGNLAKTYKTQHAMNEALASLGKFRKARLSLDISETTARSLEGDNPDVDNVAETINKSAKDLFIDPLSDDPTITLQKGSPAKDLIALFQKNDPCIETGFKNFDETTGGFIRGSFVILAAQTGQGKSMTALSLARNMFKQGYKVDYVSLEMTKRECWARAMSPEAGMPFSDLLRKETSKDDLKAIEKAWRRLTKSGPGRLDVITPTSRSDMDAILAQCSTDADVVFVDNITNLHNSGTKQQWQFLGDEAGAGKQWALRENTVLICTSHLNSDDDLAFAKGMLHHADYAWFKEAREEGEAERTENATIHQRKSRNNAPFDIHVDIDYELASVVESEKDVGDEDNIENYMDQPALPDIGAVTLQEHYNEADGNISKMLRARKYKGRNGKPVSHMTLRRRLKEANIL